MAQDKTVRIHLGGHVGARFGTEWNLYLSKPSVAEAIRAIDANTKGAFTRYLGGSSPTGRPRYYKVALARKDNLLEKGELTQPTGGGDIYILPAIKGRKDGWGKVIVGAILVIAAFYSGGASLSAGGFLGGYAGTVAGAGASLLLGGIVQLITPLPSFNQPGGGGGDNKGSNIFGGTSTAIAQGGAVPLVYGRALVSPMPISLAFTAYDQAITNSYAPMEYDIVYGEGGIIEYIPRPPAKEDSLPSD